MIGSTYDFLFCNQSWRFLAAVLPHEQDPRLMYVRPSLTMPPFSFYNNPGFYMNWEKTQVPLPLSGGISRVWPCVSQVSGGCYLLWGIAGDIHIYTAVVTDRRENGWPPPLGVSTDKSFLFWQSTLLPLRKGTKHECTAHQPSPCSSKHDTKSCPQPRRKEGQRR